MMRHVPQAIPPAVGRVVWKLPSFALGFLMCLAVAAAYGDEPPRDAGPDAQANPPQVSLAVDYGDGCQKHFTSLGWKKGMTVLDALQAAQSHPRGIRFESRGSGATVFVTRIDDLTNEGDGKNWWYHVNGKPASRSCGVFELSPGDAVLWKFKQGR